MEFSAAYCQVQSDKRYTMEDATVVPIPDHFNTNPPVARMVKVMFCGEFIGYASYVGEAFTIQARHLMALKQERE